MGGGLGRCGSGRVRRGDAVALRRIWHGIDLGHEWCAGSPQPAMHSDADYSAR